MERTNQQQAFKGLRVVLYGPESTGKTTMAKALAQHYQTAWVPEFARGYLQKKWDGEQAVCSLADLLPIAQGQLAAENDAIQKASRVLFCDTNALVTKVWSETHFDGYCAPALQSLVAQLHYDFYLLTQVDVPWEKDDLRDRPYNRDKMFEHFEAALQNQPIPYLLLSGTQEDRMLQAITALDSMLKKQHE